MDNCIRADMYHAVGTAVTNSSEKLPTTQGELAQEILKSNYDLGFVSLPPKYEENALEDVLEQRMTRFLLKLDEGWAFVVFDIHTKERKSNGCGYKTEHVGLGLRGVSKEQLEKGDRVIVKNANMYGM